MSRDAKHFPPRKRKRSSSPITIVEPTVEEATPSFVGPFWNDFTAQLSTKLWLPTKENTVEIPTSYMVKSFRDYAENSWFHAQASIASPAAHLPMNPDLWFPIVYRSLPQDVPIEEPKYKKPRKNENKPLAGKTKLIRLFPTPSQRATLAQWFGMARWTYNKCVALSRERYEEFTKAEEERKAKFKGRKFTPSKYKASSKKLKQECRNLFVNNSAFTQDELKYVQKTPTDVRDEGKTDFFKAVKSTIALKTVVGFSKFDMKFRSKKAASESIVIHSKHWKNGNINYPKTFGKEKLKSAEPLPEVLMYDTRLVKKRSGRYYLCVLSPLEIRSENQAPVSRNRCIEDGILAIDPGVRTFAAGYSPSGMTYEWGNVDIGRIYRLGLCLDKIQRKASRKYVRHRNKASKYKWTTVPMRARLKYKLRQAMRRMRYKMRCLVDDFHKKFVKWIVQHFRMVLYPKFSTKKLVRRIDRRISNKTVI